MLAYLISIFLPVGYFNLNSIHVLILPPTILQDEYAQKTGLVSQALTFSDEQKKEVDSSIASFSHIKVYLFVLYCRHCFIVLLPQ